ncbi:MAG: GNAT family N-acetyltransferase [Gammaproteobacteria bacterium]|nr:GNAT family N-acetyltransferase [Gammaproteobacteria bacterium]
MREYFLRSSRLGFSIWTHADLPLALQLWGDPEVTRLTGGPFTTAEVRDRLEREIHCHEEHGVQYWPIFLLETGEHVGCCGLQPHKPTKDSYQLGFQLRVAFWGRGFAREAAQAVVARAFTTLGIPALCAGHHPRNQASRAVLTRLGFRYTHDEFYPPTGQIEPCYLLARTDFPRVPAP